MPASDHRAGPTGSAHVAVTRHVSPSLRPGVDEMPRPGRERYRVYSEEEFFSGASGQEDFLAGGSGKLPAWPAVPVRRSSGLRRLSSSLALIGAAGVSCFLVASHVRSHGVGLRRHSLPPRRLAAVKGPASSAKALSAPRVPLRVARISPPKHANKTRRAKATGELRRSRRIAPSASRGGTVGAGGRSGDVAEGVKRPASRDASAQTPVEQTRVDAADRAPEAGAQASVGRLRPVEFGFER